ncbi:PHD-finger domain-containing protein [Phthorimaea operculella]|nr:PHD-finger domain-containing protein [Phthorimaea operculella]
MKCDVCDTDGTPNSLLRCTSCKLMFHYQCVNITREELSQNIDQYRRSWKCLSCLNINSKPRGEKVNNSVIDMSLEETIVHDQSNSGLSLQNISDLLDEKLESQVTTILDRRFKEACTSLVQNIKAEFNQTIEKLKSEFTTTTDFLTKQLKDMDEIVKSNSTRLDSLAKENTSLRQEIQCLKQQQPAQDFMSSMQKLQDDLNNKEQQSLLNDVDITGIPEFPGESVMHIVLTAANKLGCNLQECDVVTASRVGPKRTDQETGKPAWPRPIVVRLARQATRADLIKCSRTRRGATTEGLGLPDHQPRNFYVNERLTKNNRELFNLVRVAGKERNWKFVWTSYGRIYAKKTEGGNLHIFRNKEDYVRVFDAKTGTI